MVELEASKESSGLLPLGVGPGFGYLIPTHSQRPRPTKAQVGPA
jgi:hypothetical protein